LRQVVHQGQIWANNEQLMFIVDALTLGSTLHITNTHGESLLTPREEQVVAQVSAGLPNRSIARHLGVAENTVKKSLLRIFDKLGVSNRVELVLYALTQRKIKGQEPTVQRPSVSVPAPRPREKAVYADSAPNP
jgi:DNA-binding NarL/FixJ family response regulator